MSKNNCLATSPNARRCTCLENTYKAAQDMALAIRKMEDYLRLWLRGCAVFGIYVSPTSDFQWLPQNKNGLHQAWMEEKTTRSKYLLQRLYLATLSIIVCALYLHGLYAREIEHGLAVTWLVATLVYTSQVLTHLSIFMAALWKRDQHESFLQLLQQIEVSLKLHLKCNTQLRALRHSLRLLLFGLVLLSVVGLCVFTVVSVWLNDIGYYWHAAWSIITLRVRILQLLIYARILRHYLECVCVKLRQVVACRTMPANRLLDINYEKLESLEFLLAIKDNYALIFKAVQLLNDFAGWSLFGIILVYMLDFTCHVYWSLLGLDGYNSPYTYFVGTPAVLPFSVIVCHLCYVCDKCKQLVCTIFRAFNKELKKLSIFSECHNNGFSKQIDHHKINTAAETLQQRGLSVLHSITARAYRDYCSTFLCIGPTLNYVGKPVGMLRLFEKFKKFNSLIDLHSNRHESSDPHTIFKIRELIELFKRGLN
ncbi:putative gustatory receptor 39b [Zeugodacus cucurbitae]|uniref:putative gustatory receptor 39b n=1 Tax=Zeugodacus cucurbitae TaxID=28588 RepID=UPI0023D8F5D5|nr:putative gustatory receptor 39b [Zeugodacus cucurbitae]